MSAVVAAIDTVLAHDTTTDVEIPTMYKSFCLRPHCNQSLSLLHSHHVCQETAYMHAIGMLVSRLQPLRVTREHARIPNVL